MWTKKVWKRFIVLKYFKSFRIVSAVDPVAMWRIHRDSSTVLLRLWRSGRSIRVKESTDRDEVVSSVYIHFRPNSLSDAITSLVVSAPTTDIFIRESVIYSPLQFYKVNFMLLSPGSKPANRTDKTSDRIVNSTPFQICREEKMLLSDNGLNMDLAAMSIISNFQLDILLRSIL